MIMPEWSSKGGRNKLREGWRNLVRPSPLVAPLYHIYQHCQGNTLHMYIINFKHTNKLTMKLATFIHLKCSMNMDNLIDCIRPTWATVVAIDWQRDPINPETNAVSSGERRHEELGSFFILTLDTVTVMMSRLLSASSLREDLYWIVCKFLGYNYCRVERGFCVFNCIQCVTFCSQVTKI